MNYFEWDSENSFEGEVIHKIARNAVVVKTTKISRDKKNYKPLTAEEKSKYEFAVAVFQICGRSNKWNLLNGMTNLTEEECIAFAKAYSQMEQAYQILEQKEMLSKEREYAEYAETHNDTDSVSFVCSLNPFRNLLNAYLQKNYDATISYKIREVAEEFLTAYIPFAEC